MIDLYKKNVWNDSKTVNIIGEACLSPSPKLVATAVNFFLSVNEKSNDSDEEDEEKVWVLVEVSFPAKAFHLMPFSLHRLMSLR